VSDVSEVSSDARFAGAAFSLQEGEVSAPVETDHGWFVMKMLAREPAADEGLPEQGALISSELLQREQRQLFSSWIESLKAEATVKDYRRQLL
jgi:parvulin-like peptidyl-prolyl isomerase